MNTMVRYVVCGNNVTVIGILKLYNKLPEDIKQALASSGITVQTIQRSGVVNTDGRFDINKVREGMITEIAA